MRASLIHRELLRAGRGRDLRRLSLVMLWTLAAPGRLEGAQPDGPTSQPAPDLTPRMDPLDLGSDDAADLELLKLEVPTVIAATRREQSISHLPYAISVISQEDIRHSGARSVPDALRLAAGMDVAELSYGLYAVSPRGLHSVTNREVLVLVDGRQIFDAFFGGTLWGGWPFQLEDIERIEVIRGPGGVTWGANAVNGVINIITKDPADQQGVTMTAGGGSRGTNTEHVGYGLVDGKLRLRVSGEHESSDGFQRGGSLLTPLDDPYRAGRANVHGIYDASPRDRWTFSIGSALVENGYPAGVARLLGEHQAGSQANFGMARWERTLARDHTIQTSVFVNEFRLSNPIAPIEYGYQQIGFLFSHSFKPAEQHTFTWGIDNRTDLLDATNADPMLLSKSYVDTHIIGVYAEDEWRFAPKWTFTLGARADYEFYGGLQPSARASLAYELTADSALFAAVSRAFQMPAAAGRFVAFPLVPPLLGLRSDDTLAPERLMAYEVGYRGNFFNRLEVSGSLFWHEYNDTSALHPALGPPGLVSMVFENAASPALYGLELEAEYRLNSRLTLHGHYTFERMDWDGYLPIHATDLIVPPKHKFMLGSRYRVTDDLWLSGQLHYVDAARSPDPVNPLRHRRVDPYFRLDLRAEHEFWHDRASVAVGVRNLLDPHHFEGSSRYFNSAEVPRMVYAELRVRLDP